MSVRVLLPYLAQAQTMSGTMMVLLAQAYLIMSDTMRIVQNAYLPDHSWEHVYDGGAGLPTSSLVGP
jgi:hypothetical protein